MENYQTELHLENEHLKQIITIAQSQLSEARHESLEKEASIFSAKEELREETVHSLANFYSSQGFHDFAALSQYMAPVSDKLNEHETLLSKIQALEMTVYSPYFARIDFKFDDEDTSEKIYIGRTSLMNHKSYEIYIYDWRSPIASMFYRFGTGSAFYEAPAGKISGEINLKRQYEINNGKLEYFFDADIQIVDEFLRKMLSQNTSPQMKTIVETIQKDQDIVIRDLENDLIMVQGSAGSGKTSIGLHRVAYLMYQGLTAKLSSNNIIIISPNTLFEKYIANVLPELGEKNVDSIIFEDICKQLLPHTQIQTRNQLLENMITDIDKNHKMIVKNSMAFKSSTAFIEILNRFIHDIPRRWLSINDIRYGGKLIADRQQLKNKILTEEKTTFLDLRLKKVEQIILNTVHELRKERIKQLEEFVITHTDHLLDKEEFTRLLSIEEITVLIKEVRKFTRLNIPDLYRMLFHDKDYFYRIAKGIHLPDCIEDIIDYTCENLKGDCLLYEDALALAFLHLKIYNYNDYQLIKQVVIDEAQDYNPLHFAILKILFPGARYTILGDINQTIEKQKDLSMYQQISKILGKKNAALYTLDKSFRSTNEILAYSNQFISGDAHIKSFSRKGDIPKVYRASSQSAYEDMLIDEIMICREKGYLSIGLICKSEEDTFQLFAPLKDKLDIHLTTNDSTMNLKGTFIMPVYLSKGLEFDAVLICDTDEHHYHTEEDKKLLYIASTRALHRLNLFYMGDASPLLENQALVKGGYI